MMTDHKERFNKWAKKYDKSILQYLLFNRTHDKMIQLMKLEDSYNVLDIACGTGKFLRKLENRSEYLYLYGVDYSKKMIIQAKKENKGNIKYSIAPAEQLPYYDNKFHIIACSHAFHHFDNQYDAIKEFHRVLTKNGILIIADGCVDNFWGNILFGKIITFIEKNVHHVPAEVLKEELQNQGFKVYKQIVINKIAPTLITVARKI